MCASMSAVIIDAREVFGDLQRATRAERFEAELSAFERQCSDRARTFIDMFRSRGLGAKAPPVGNLFHLVDGRRPARSGLRLASGQNIVRPPRKEIRERLGTSRSGGDGTTWGRRAYANLSRFHFRSSATLLQFPKIPVSPSGRRLRVLGCSVSINPERFGDGIWRLAPLCSPRETHRSDGGRLAGS